MHLYKTKKLITFKGCITAVAVFIAVLFLCVFTTYSLSGNVEEDKAARLKEVIDNAIVTCYSIEGAYPESLEYIVENYGVVIDEDKYIVSYSVFAKNIKPQVKVIEINK
ncbi:MAG: hypothetical protein E7266_01725 [Lachnospiraceae bacterium]|nr:hypothetical protein [Lachnospiraceae bacterium]